MATFDLAREKWRRVKFGDVMQLSKARCADPLAEGYERHVGLENLEPGDLRIRSCGYVADGATFTNVFQPGQVLFGKRPRLSAKGGYGRHRQRVFGLHLRVGGQSL